MYPTGEQMTVLQGLTDLFRMVSENICSISAVNVNFSDAIMPGESRRLKSDSSLPWDLLNSIEYMLLCACHTLRGLPWWFSG